MSSWRVAFLASSAGLAVLFLGNVLFHGVLARQLFDRELAGVLVPLGSVHNPVYPLIIAALMAATMAWFTARLPARGRVAEGSGFGALLSVVVYGTWNLL